MAGHGGPASVDDGTVPEVDIAAHQATFDAFVGLTKWTIIFVALLLIGMAIFLL